MENPATTFSTFPDVSPGDVWGDAACLMGEGQGAAVMLPPKRVKPSDKHPGAVDGRGFRIGSRVPVQTAGEEISQLEVQQIDGSVVRLQPEEPAAPRMPRHVVFHERPVNEEEARLAGEAREWGISNNRPPLFWILGTGMVVAAMVVGAISLLPLVNKSNAAGPRPGDSELVIEPVTNAEALNDMLARQTEAERVYRSYLGAPSVEAVLPLLRDPEQLVDLVREKHRSGDGPARIKTRAWGARETESLTYGLLAGTLPDFSDFEAYFTLSDGRLVMDWKASTAYGTADFAQLKEKMGNPAEIRGWIEAAEFYSLAFPENSYQSYQLASPDQQQVLWVYARRGSEIQSTLKTLIKGGYILAGRVEPQKATVRLDPGPAAALPGQWEIVELLHKEWIAP